MHKQGPIGLPLWGTTASSPLRKMASEGRWPSPRLSTHHHHEKKRLNVFFTKTHKERKKKAHKRGPVGLPLWGAAASSPSLKMASKGHWPSPRLEPSPQGHPSSPRFVWGSRPSPRCGQGHQSSPWARQPLSAPFGNGVTAHSSFFFMFF